MTELERPSGQVVGRSADAPAPVPWLGRSAPASAPMPRLGRSADAPAAVPRLDRSAPPPVVAPRLDAQQRAVVDHRDGHLLVLAGPGTGKTTTLAELVVARIGPEAGVDRLEPGRVLALTFGRRAARELSDRISRRIGGGPLPVVSTFHSFAYGVLRQYAQPDAFLSPPRLLSAAEQEARLRELLTWSVTEGRLRWPESLAGAIGTRGIAEQVRALLARARGQGLDGPALARFGRRDAVPAWTAVGRFFDEYLDTLGFEGTLDYAELIHNAVALASKEKQGRALRETYQLIVVDEYQDTDPAQVRLLTELARGGAQVVAVGDPDQAIYAFRGADLGGILRFPEQFRHPVTGAPARIEVLRTARRFPRAIGNAAAGVLGALPSGLPAEVLRLHRSPQAVDGPAVVEARTYPRASAEAAGIAETLLRAHSGADGVGPLAWSQMAVLVRNPAVHGPAIARALRAAGVPVSVPAEEVALVDEPSVQTLLSIVTLAADPESVPEDTGRMLLAGPVGRLDPVAIRALARAALAQGEPDQDAPVQDAPAQDAPVRDAPVPVGEGEPGFGEAGFGEGARRDPAAGHRLTEEWPAEEWPAGEPAAREPGRGEDGLPPDPLPLSRSASEDSELGSQMGSGSAGRALGDSAGGSDVDVAESSALARLRTGARGPSSDALLTAALAESAAAPDLSERAGLGAAGHAGFARVRAAVRAARTALESHALVSEVLWAAWSASDWPDRLRERALRGGHSAGSAHRDLDALVALFDLANRLPGQRAGRVGLQGFLADLRQLRIPPESRPADDAERDQVRLLSAHRAKGLEWELVVVAAVQEGEWPDVRLRSDLLHVAELESQGRQPPRTYADLLAEERRLMYVACTRARRALVVTAVAEPVDGGAQPSRFLAALGVPVVAMPARSATPVSGPGLVAALRAAATAPERIGPDGSPDPGVEVLRHAAIERLARLAALVLDGAAGGVRGGVGSGAVGRATTGASGGVGGGAAGASTGANGGVGSPLAAADPARWWGVRPPTGSSPLTAMGPPCGVERSDERELDVGASEATIRLSPSSVEALRTCPLRWFLEKKVGAGTSPGSAAAIGVVVHAVAEALGRGTLPADPSAIADQVDEIWSGMPFAARYQSAHERVRVEEMVNALLTWQLGTGRHPRAVEAPFSLALPTPTGTVTLAGTIDRVDQDDHGHLHLVDFKTGRTAATAAAAAEHPQLGIYQLAVREGALQLDGSGEAQSRAGSKGVAADSRPDASTDFSAVAAREAADPSEEAGAAGPTGAPLLGGAELVNLADRFTSGLPKVRRQAPLPDGRTWVHEVVVDAARLAIGPGYPARRNARCGSCAFQKSCPAHETPTSGQHGESSAGAVGA